MEFQKGVFEGRPELGRPELASIELSEPEIDSLEDGADDKLGPFVKGINGEELDDEEFRVSDALALEGLADGPVPVGKELVGRFPDNEAFQDGEVGLPEGETSEEGIFESV